MSKKIKSVKAQESIGDHTPYLPTDEDTPKGKVYDEPGIIRTTSIVNKPLLETYTSDTPITKYDLITSLCRDGLPAYTFDTVFSMYASDNQNNALQCRVTGNRLWLFAQSS